MKLPVTEFKSKYLSKTDEGFIINKTPCPFLTESGCSIYEYRPENCREYPYTDKEEIWERLINLVQNCDVCPVVFEIFERLKKHYRDEFENYKEEYQKLWGNESMLANSGVVGVSERKVKVGRNDSCPCGSGKKYKKCCGK